jgi:hypothetical protein
MDGFNFIHREKILIDVSAQKKKLATFTSCLFLWGLTLKSTTAAAKQTTQRFHSCQ